MKHIKISLAVVALVLGTGAAFAGKTKASVDPCTETTTCSAQTEFQCCYDVPNDETLPGKRITP